MKKKLIALALVLLLAQTVFAGSRPVWVCINGQEGLLLDSRGQLLSRLEFDGRGQALAGPLPPGRYTVRTEAGDVHFILQPNASVTHVTGPGRSDGELLWLD
jgi:hypothetical protein